MIQSYFVLPMANGKYGKRKRKEKTSKSKDKHNLEI